MIDTQKLRKVAEGANEFARGDVAEWPLTTKNHIRSLASTAIQCADALDAQTAEIARLREALGSIRQYSNDTLSGRADGGPDDRKWQREAVIEMRNRARAALQEKSNG